MPPAKRKMVASLEVITSANALQQLLSILHDHGCRNYVLSSFDYAKDRHCQGGVSDVKACRCLVSITAACDADIVDVVLDDITSQLTEAGEIFTIVDPCALPH